jgi:hypothetical protein
MIYHQVLRTHGSQQRLNWLVPRPESSANDAYLTLYCSPVRPERLPRQVLEYFFVGHTESRRSSSAIFLRRNLLQYEFIHVQLRWYACVFVGEVRADFEEYKQGVTDVRPARRELRACLYMPLRELTRACPVPVLRFWNLLASLRLGSSLQESFSSFSVAFQYITSGVCDHLACLARENAPPR